MKIGTGRKFWKIKGKNGKNSKTCKYKSTWCKCNSHCLLYGSHLPSATFHCYQYFANFLLSNYISLQPLLCVLSSCSQRWS